MKHLLSLFVCISVLNTSAQNLAEEYTRSITVADSLYTIKEYKRSALAYSSAFKINGANLLSKDIYNAACSWALAGFTDSAFLHLEIIVSKFNFSNYSHISSDLDLITLHNDKRWVPLIERVKKNKELKERNYNKPLVQKLDSIYASDQTGRLQINELRNKYGNESTEVNNLIKKIIVTDSINLVNVKAILDKYGWLSTDIIGQQGSLTLFLVIQHSDTKTQEKYIPMLREAVKKGNANSEDLAYLEDRLALAQGKKQIYGSQIFKYKEGGDWFVLPVEDPDNIDKRRSEVGLEPFRLFLKNNFNIIWNCEQYKKDLPSIEKKLKEMGYYSFINN